MVGTLVTSYYGPRRLEQWREGQRETREFGPRKELLKQMLRESDHPIRTLDMLKHVTGTSADDCRRLLIEIGARGVVMSGDREGWALIERYPLDRAYEQTR